MFLSSHFTNQYGFCLLVNTISAIVVNWKIYLQINNDKLSVENNIASYIKLTVKCILKDNLTI